MLIRSDDEPPPLVERVSAVSLWRRDSGAWRWPQHEWWLHYTVPAPWGIRFVCAKHKLMKFVPRVNRPRAKRCERFWWKSWIRLWPWFQWKQQHPHDTVISFFGSLALLGKSRGKTMETPVIIYWWIIMLQQFICWVNFSFQAHPNPMLLVKNIPLNHIKSHKHILSESHSQP